MKRALLTLTLIISIFLSITACSGGGGAVVNDTGFDIYNLYVSPSSSSEWGDDVLGSSILEDGDRHSVTLIEGGDLYDIRAVDEDDDTYTIMSVDLREGNYTITLEDLD